MEATMATDKAKRSNPLAQPSRRRINPHHKAELFDDLRQLNRGYGTARESDVDTACQT
jgi:hypothetical protein